MSWKPTNKQIRNGMLLGFGAWLLYLIFFVQLGGQTVAKHAQDVLHSPVVQNKFTLMQEGLKNRVQHNMNRVADYLRANPKQPNTTLADNKKSSQAHGFNAQDRERIRQIIIEQRR